MIFPRSAFFDQDADGDTVMHHLARGGNDMAIRAFADSSSIVRTAEFRNTRNLDGRTAIEEAVHCNQLGAVVGLVRFAKADYHSFDANGRSLADRAYSEGAREISRYLQDHADTSRREALDAAPADANLRDHQGWTQLHHAVKERDWEQIDLLIEEGANWHARDFNGESPIWILAREGDAQAFNAFAARGIMIDKSNRNGESLIHAAAASGNLKMIDAVCGWAQREDRNLAWALTKKGDVAGNTPLHVAARRAQTDEDEGKWVAVVRRLGQYGANPWYGNNRGGLGRLPLAEATVRGRLKVAHALLDLMEENQPADMDTGEKGFGNGELVANGDWNDCLHFAVLQPSASLVKRLLPMRPVRSSPKSIALMTIGAEGLRDRAATSEATQETAAEAERVLEALRAAPDDDAFARIARETKAAVRREEQRRLQEREARSGVAGPAVL